MAEKVIMFKVDDNNLKFAECLAFLFEDAGTFPHPSYENFEEEIKALKGIRPENIKVKGCEQLVANLEEIT